MRLARMTCKPRQILALLLALSLCTILLQLSKLNSSIFQDMHWARINLTFAHDLLINLGTASPPRHSPSQQAIKGFRIMSASNVTVLGVARNIAHQLPHVLSLIETLSLRFILSRAIIVEGDSEDETLPLLRSWALKSPRNRTILVTSRKNLTDKHNEWKGFAMPREGAIATARNLGLAHMRQLLPTTYVVVVDMDLLGVSETGFADSMGREDSWEVICSHGVILHGIYRDTYAFRTKDINTNHHWGDEQNRRASTEARRIFKKMSHDSKLKAYELADHSSNSMELLPVQSCFGGLAIYKSAAMEGCDYGFRYDSPPFMLDCEHVIFHKCMSDRHRARVLSNPHMYAILLLV